MRASVYPNVTRKPPMKKTVLFFVVMFCLSAMPAFAQSNKAAEDAIRKIDADWVKAAQTKNPDAWMAFYADDAAVLPPNEKTARDRASIRKSVSGLLSLPGLNINWTPTKVEVAKSGDVGYLYGTYEMTFTDSSGKQAKDSGKMVEIWKKQADEKWKCIVDMWSSDLPVTPPTK
jgi:uncharacterized protein (TIGR02246 family)